MSPFWYKFLADAVVVFHFAFVGFVLFGGLLVLRWRWLKWVHLPCVAWGIWIELSHGLCPLTPLENDLRAKAGVDTYQGGFVDHYIMPVLYPDDLTPGIQVAIAFVIIAINGACYESILSRWLWTRRRARFTAAGVAPVRRAFKKVRAAPLEDPAPPPTAPVADQPAPA